MKLFKLWVHQKGFSEDELVINPKEFPDVKVGDILEIYHPDEDNSHLLLQVKSLQTDLQQTGKDIISVDQTIANLFQLRAYKDVEVCRVSSAQDIGLDLVEVVFKDQYISRSDMWRLKNSLIGTCAYLSKKVEYSGIRAQVNELWARGEKVMCGVVSDDTRVAFRSSTAMVYMFIQMSSEMWEFDSNGDLLWEKAINGFVSDLFHHWRERNTVNEVTIFLFSRIYYGADSLDEFPVEMRSCLHTDYRGRIYEDFYRVIVQNERRDDWTPLLVTLKSHCIEYGQRLQHHYKQDLQLRGFEDAYISNASEGNFLEALNLSLNVFDKHYINRNFDRTGQVVVTVTPGAGVFDVDRELYKITKKRMIDNGIGSDLVCMAEQPLHAVPLFRFHGTNRHQSVRDYNIPHWLNYSFYTTRGQLQKCCIHSSFTPRIKLAQKQESTSSSAMPHLPPLPKEWNKNYFKKSRQDEDYVFGEHDSGIFKAPSYASPKPRTPFSIRPSKSAYSSILPLRSKEEHTSHTAKKSKDQRNPNSFNFSAEPAEAVNGQHSVSKSSSSTAIPIPERANLVTPSVSVTAAARLLQETSMSRSFGPAHGEGMKGTPLAFNDGIVGSANAIHDRISSSPHHQFVYRTLINPFTPSVMAVRITSNRRRWTHTFPPGPSGETVQPHHRRWTISEDDPENSLGNIPGAPTESISAPANQVASPPRQPMSPTRSSGLAQLRLAPPQAPNNILRTASASSLGSEGSTSGNQTNQNGAARQSGVTHRQSGNLPDLGGSRTSPASDSFRTLPRSTSGLWGVTGEQEWTPYIKTGMDWKSLTATACFPVTTDYYPDTQTVEKQFMENNYELLADDHDDVVGELRQTGEGVFQEIIAQRLMQGFQMVVVPKSHLAIVQGRRSKDILVTDVNKHEYVLSIGRIFHKLVLHLQQRAISVTVYKPRHLNTSRTVYYTYQLWSAHNSGYQPSSVDFRPFLLENFNWNYLDNYVASKGIDFGPMESLKLWRSRFLLLPSLCSKKKRVLEDPAAHLDIFTEELGRDEAHQLTEGFIKFVETLNRMRRHHSGNRRPKAMNIATLTNLVPGRQQAVVPPAQPGTLSQAASGQATADPGTPPRSLKEEGDEADWEGLEDDRSRLTLWTPLWEIARAMKDTRWGVQILPSDHRKIPTNCFVAFEGVQWIIANLQGDVLQEEAVELLQNMTEEGLLCHASGNPHHPFWNGFYLYYLLDEDPHMKDKSKRSPSRSSASSARLSSSYAAANFPNRWFEIALCGLPPPASKASSDKQRVPQFLASDPPRPASPATSIMMSCAEVTDSLSEELDGISGMTPPINQASQKPASFKTLLFDNFTTKTSRVEWCHINYDGCYSAEWAWGFQVEWLVSTPSLLVEVLQGWARKAVQCGFHLVPAPMDAFNQCPYFNNPLSCPRFIQLDLQCLSSAEGRGLFEDFDPDSRDRRVHLLQEAILKRFGFIKATETFPLSSITPQHSMKEQVHYVHVTGMALVLICPPIHQDTALWDVPMSPRQAASPGSSFPDEGELGVFATPDETHREHPSTAASDVGFKWVPNYLLTKRWRTSSCGDEKLPERLLSDFTSFCQNRDNRLSQFWERSLRASGDSAPE